MKIKNILIILLVSAACNVFAGITTHRYEFTNPIINYVEDWAEIEMTGCLTTGIEGHPALPVYGLRLLLPPGESLVNITYELPEPILIQLEKPVSPVQAQYPLSYPGPFQPTPPVEEIYNSQTSYPAETAQNYQTHYFRGYSLGFAALHPVKYDPQNMAILYYPWIEVSVISEPSDEAQTAYSQMYRGIASDYDKVSRMIDNQAITVGYGSAMEAVDDEFAKYLIITTEMFVPNFQVLADYKNATGIATEIVTTQYIQSAYSGNDLPAKIRNCIIEYYQGRGTEYVLLAGDNEYVPKRGFYNAYSDKIDYDIAADIYYGCLDGTWDNNNNGIWGEAGVDDDLIAEVYPGRAAVSNSTQADNFVNKQIMYQCSPVASELDQALMTGEDLGWLAWGGDYKEEIRLGSSNWGYTTVGFPPNFTVGTLYDAPGSYWSAMSDLLPLLNEGPHLVNHLGHANNTYALKFGIGSVNDDNMTNDGENHNFYMIYSQGCYCNAWDNRTPEFGVSMLDAIAEKWTTIENGAVAFIGNTRYGWGDSYSTNGSSQYYDREFFDAIFGEDITQIGWAHQDSKEDCIPFIEYGANRWCYYDCSLLGDPTLTIWTGIPQEIALVSAEMISVGDNIVTVYLDIDSALCAVSQNNILLGTGYTDINGEAVITLWEAVEDSQPVRLLATKSNYLPLDLELAVYTPNSPNLITTGCIIDDGETGDGDGVLDLGETAEFNLEIVNYGGVAALSVQAELIIDNMYVEAVRSSMALGSLSAGDTLSFDGVFEIEAASNIPDEYVVVVTVNLTDNANIIWPESFQFEASAPDVELVQAVLNDYNDLRFVPGESAEISVSLINNGSGEGRQVSVSIFTDDPFLQINQGYSSCSVISSGETVELLPLFTVTAASGCPPAENIPVYITIEDTMGYVQGQMFEIYIGGFLFNFENTMGTNWIHSAVTAGFSDQWHISTYRNYTPGGGQSWHCGEIDGGDYDNYLDAALLTEPILLQPGSILTFYHWMNAETIPQYPYYCYDGGLVEMSYDGVVFFQIAPIGYYNYIIRQMPDMGPFGQGKPVYSGEIVWEQAVFSLAQYPCDTAMFRFRFGSNSTGVREGWYIDDLEITHQDLPSPPVNLAAELMEDSTTVILTWSSPGFNPPAGKTSSGGRVGESLYYYKVYRDNTLIANNVQALYFEDNLCASPAGSYSYQVSGVFSWGESVKSNPVLIDYTVVGVNNRDNLIPQQYFVEPNRPNPFNPVTTISFGLPEATRVKLTVYNLLGQRAALLADEVRQPGYYQVTWNAEGFPSGLYFFMFETEGLKYKGKMLLLK